jgi:hypothetical protein
MARSNAARSVGCVVGPVVLLAVLAFTATMVTVIVAVGIWPGEAKLTAPILCPEDRPDAYVVADTYQVQPGETSTTFTMYCLGPRGETTDVGFFRPMALLTAFHALLLVGLGLLFTAPRLLRRRRSRPGGPPTGSSAPDDVPVTAPGPGSAPGDETEFEAPGPIIS